MTDLVSRLLLSPSSDLRRDLARRTIKEVIADKIAALIASGMMGLGDALPSERHLAAALSVSRETVRGAVQILAARGILEVSQGAHTRIARTDFTDSSLGTAVGIANRINVNAYSLEEVHTARLLIEQQVVGDAALAMGPEVLAGLRRSLAAQEECRNDPVRFLICDREFHVAIYRSCGSQLLSDIVTDLYTYMMEHRRRALSRPGAIDDSLADHAAIVAALESRDRPAAMAAFAAHEERIYSSTLNQLARTGQEGD